MNAYILAAGFAAMFALGYWARGQDNKPPAPGDAGHPPVGPKAAQRQPPSLRRPPPGAGPAPAQASDASPPPGPGTTARVLRFRADLDCDCEITHLLPRTAANSMHTKPCPEHGWCGLCGWRIGALDGGRYAYVWETCPAHDTNQARHP